MSSFTKYLICAFLFKICIWQQEYFSSFPFPDDNCLLLFLGFDHCHPEVYEHCKRLLLHLLIVMGSNSNIRTVASVLLRNKEFNEPRVRTVKQIAHLDYTFTGICFKSSLKIEPYFINLAFRESQLKLRYQRVLFSIVLLFQVPVTLLIHKRRN